MPNETETKTPTQEATPAPVAGTPAPETKPAAPVAQAAPETVAKPSETTPKEPADFFKQREAKREKKATERLAELEKEHNALKAQFEKVKPVAEPEPEPLFSLDDPEGSFKKMKDQAAREAVETLKREQAEYAAQTSYIQTAEGAEKFLLTRSHLKDDQNAQAEIARILQEQYSDVAAYGKGSNPKAAAELAYFTWCRSKGVIPDMEGFSNPNPQNATAGRAAAGVSPSAPGGAKTWTKREAEAYLMEATKDPAKYRLRSSEIDQAKSEGRIK